VCGIVGIVSGQNQPQTMPVALPPCDNHSERAEIGYRDGPPGVSPEFQASAETCRFRQHPKMFQLKRERKKLS